MNEKLLNKSNYKKAISVIFTLMIILCINPGLSFAGAKATSYLGEQSFAFGSHNQALALLQLMENVPDANEYQISYQTGSEIVLFGCDVSKNVLIRMHNRQDGHGTAESWAGHIRHRLESAAAGGSLNDTPAGKAPGTFNTF